jgi:hypothetical protein
MANGNQTTNPAQARVDAEVAALDAGFLQELNKNLEFLIGVLGQGGLGDLVGTGNIGGGGGNIFPNEPFANLMGAGFAGQLGQRAAGPFTVNMGGSPFEINPLGTQLTNLGVLLESLTPENREALKKAAKGLGSIFGLPGPGRPKGGGAITGTGLAPLQARGGSLV